MHGSEQEVSLSWEFGPFMQEEVYPTQAINQRWHYLSTFQNLTKEYTLIVQINPKNSVSINSFAWSNIDKKCFKWTKNFANFASASNRVWDYAHAHKLSNNTTIMLLMQSLIKNIYQWMLGWAQTIWKPTYCWQLAMIWRNNCRKDEWNHGKIVNRVESSRSTSK